MVLSVLSLDRDGPLAKREAKSEREGTDPVSSLQVSPAR